MVDRAAFRQRVLDTASPPVLVPLSLDPLTARLCEELGYEAGYVSGGALGYQLAVSEALLTLTELAQTTAAIVRRSNLAVVVDGGVGFGDPVHVTRMMWEFEAAGAAAVEIEDQVAPKRVSHHRGIEHLVPTEDMMAKIRFAIAARKDENFLVIARTGAVRHEGFDAAIARGKAYRDAGADLIMIFPDTAEEWEAAPTALGAPTVAMASLDTRPPAQWAEFGYRMVIDPFTGQVVAMDAIRNAYQHFHAHGTSGHDLKALMNTYRQFPGLAGLDELYDIERATTEPGT